MDINSILNSAEGSLHSKQGSYFGIINSANPYRSGTVYLSGFSQFSLSLNCFGGDATISVYGLDSNGSAPSSLIYQKTVSNNVEFNRRFAASYHMVYYEITTDVVDDCVIRLLTHRLSSAQFDSAKYINSTYSIENNAQLVLNANNFHMDLVRGMHDEFKKVNIEGEVQATPGGTPFTMGLDDLFTPSQTAEQLYIVSSSGDDTNAGTGATTIRIIYINDQGEQVEQVYPTSGLVKASLFGVVARAVIRVEVESTGGDGANQGDITIDNLAGTKVYALIRAGTLSNVSHGAIYMVPDNKQLVLREINLTGVNHGADVVIHSWIWKPSTNEYIAYTLGSFRINTTNIMIRYDFDGLLSEKDVITIDIYPDSATSAKTSFSANLNGMLCPLPNVY